MTVKLTEETKKEIQETLEYCDIDDMHLYAGMQNFRKFFTDEVSLEEFLRFANKDLKHYFELPAGYLELFSHHEPLSVVLGEAIHALQIRLLDPELEMACSKSVAIRVITALTSNSEEILKFMIYDPCYLVRKAVYDNPASPKDFIDIVKGDDIFFKTYYLDEIDELGPHADYLAHRNSCNCSPDGLNDLVHEVWNDEGLEIPPIAHEFEQRIEFFGGRDFGTQPLPGPMRDYLFLDIIDYLKEPIPDQYVLSYAGHGINSYSLNFRYALGDLAIMMQVGYGGAYGDTSEDGKLWDEVVDRLGNIMLINPENRKEGLWQRKYLILFSDFRIDKNPRLLVNQECEWHEVPLVKSWDELDEYFSFWGSVEDLMET